MTRHRMNDNRRVLVITEYWAKPIPIRKCDWQAHLDDWEPGLPIGTGETEADAVYDLFMQDLHQVFTVGVGPTTLAHELALYRNFGVSVQDLPQDKRITLWHGLSDNIVPPAMACQMALSLPNREAHLVAGGHFVAIDIAGPISARLRQLLEEPV